MNKGLTVGLGEVLWDVFPEGPRFGGAPANFACHAASFGPPVAMVSRVGKDELGDRAIRFLQQCGIETDGVSQSEDLPTGTVKVQLDERNSPSYEIAAPVAWDAIQWSDRLGRIAQTTQAVSFGTLAQRSEASRSAMEQFLRATPKEALRVFDVNLRQSFYSAEIIRQSLELANVLKLNHEELPIVADACDVAAEEVEQLHSLREEYELHLVAMTRGAAGAVIVGPDGISDSPGYQTRVRDSVGAGDAFTATLAIGMLQGRAVDAINRHACRVAAYVCSQSGATPPLPDELKSFP